MTSPHSTSDTNTNSTQKTLWSLIKDIKFGMLTHRHANGMLHSHPLTTQNKSDDEGSHLYFFVSRKGELARRLQDDGNVNVSYADPGADTYVSLSGQASIVEDQAKKEALWSPIAKAWFPGGVTDPDLALLEVGLGHAEYWDVDESKMVQLFKMAKAAITGDTPPHLGEHKELNVS
ncbi:MAG TPA: pyridoxamine 5'-phosphate oxidase family protein [Polaromonas sp.]|uniref:pyridoxamine 5'-phosphate oxidase family protein n=1 Tax=Polaromonas sp. TaxID=1869339 RepID=UPI002D4A58B2|nr:pyridoxamine 5'-phosphate oxidase family protein [Polaromonas sp.]HYW56038.1 pyridoxamine 5'-phosphate oxidase family protein [Polaromonas sp.]